MFRDEDSEFTTVPAAPGWYVCVLYDGLECLTDEPIVAWEIERWASSKKRRFLPDGHPDLHGELFQRQLYCASGRVDISRPLRTLPRPGRRQVRHRRRSARSPQNATRPAPFTGCLMACE